MLNMDGAQCPYQSHLRELTEETDEWKASNEHFQPLFDQMAEKWELERPALDFSSAYPYIDAYYSTWFDEKELGYEDLDQEGQDLV